MKSVNIKYSSSHPQDRDEFKSVHLALPPESEGIIKISKYFSPFVDELNYNHTIICLNSKLDNDQTCSVN